MLDILFTLFPSPSQVLLDFVKRFLKIPILPRTFFGPKTELFCSVHGSKLHAASRRHDGSCPPSPPFSFLRWFLPPQWRPLRAVHPGTLLPVRCEPRVRFFESPPAVLAIFSFLNLRFPQFFYGPRPFRNTTDRSPWPKQSFCFLQCLCSQSPLPTPCLWVCTRFPVSPPVTLGWSSLRHFPRWSSLPVLRWHPFFFLTADRFGDVSFFSF